mgnify:CR=1 FL=1
MDEHDWTHSLTSSGEQWVLPPRRLPYLGLIACGVMAFGLVFLGVGLKDLIAAAFAPSGGGGWNLLGALFALPFAGFGTLFTGAGLMAGFSRTVVRLERDRLVAADRVGRLAWRRSRPLSEIEALGTGVSEVRVNDSPVSEGPWADASILVAGPNPPAETGSHGRENASTGRKPVVVAIGYPSAVLGDFAGELSEAIGRVSGGEPPRVIIDDDPAAPNAMVADANTVLEDFLRSRSPERGGQTQPEGSTAVIERGGQAETTIRLPQTGIWGSRKARTLFISGLLWLGFIAAMVGTVIIGPMFFGSSQPPASPPPQNASAQPWWVVAIIGVIFGIGFPAVGVFCTLQGLSWGRRRSSIDVIGGGLLITQRRLFTQKVWRWDPGSIDRVFVGYSGFEQNDRPIYNLRIAGTPAEPRGGRAREIGFFSARDDDELRWIASELNNALGLVAERLTVPAKPGEFVP